MESMTIGGIDISSGGGGGLLADMRSGGGINLCHEVVPTKPFCACSNRHRRIAILCEAGLPP